MKRFLAVLGVLVAATGTGTAPAAAGTTALTATLQPTRTSTTVGRHFAVQARVSNTGSAASGRLLAHLNVLSLQREVYVDPEDWSSDRTRELAPLPPGASTTLTWSVQAVNTGRFAVYFVLAPKGPAPAGAGPLVVSSPNQVVVAARQTLNPGGSLVVVVAVPVLVGAAALATRWRRRAGSGDMAGGSSVRRRSHGDPPVEPGDDARGDPLRQVTGHGRDLSVRDANGGHDPTVGA